MGEPRELTCREIVELVTDYLEGALSPEDTERFELHIVRCEGCEIYLEQMRVTLRALSALNREQAEAEVPDALIEAFRGWRSREGG